MNLTILFSINYLAIAVSSVVFFILGSVWFSGLFRSAWTKELQHHNVIIKEPTTADLITKMLLTFAANILASVAMAFLVIMTGSASFQSGLLLGIIAALGFALTTLGSVFIWESRSLKLFLIDVGYPMLGIITSAIILSLWS